MAPTLAGWHKKYAARGLVVIDVDNGRRDTLDAVLEHVQKSGGGYSVLWDQEGANCKAYAIRGFPAAFLIDASGRVVWEGFPNPQLPAIEKAIEKALSEVKEVKGAPEPKPKENPKETPKPTKEGALVTTPSGLQYADLKTGDGAEAKPGATVDVHYTGWLENGTKFDSSLDRGQPFSFQLGAGQVIQGWDEGVAGMKPGGRRKLVIPSALGYGDRGAGEAIPPGATLVFEVELLKIR